MRRLIFVGKSPLINFFGADRRAFLLHARMLGWGPMLDSGIARLAARQVVGHSALSDGGGRLSGSAVRNAEVRYPLTSTGPFNRASSPTAQSWLRHSTSKETSIGLKAGLPRRWQIKQPLADVAHMVDGCLGNLFEVSLGCGSSNVLFVFDAHQEQSASRSGRSRLLPRAGREQAQ